MADNPDEIDLSPLPDYSSVAPHSPGPPNHELALRLRKLAIKPVKRKLKVRRKMRVRNTRDVRFY